MHTWKKATKAAAMRWAAVLACSALLAASKPTTQTATVNSRAYGDKDTIDPQLAKLFEATPITLNVEKLPGLQALNQLAKASGYAIKPGYAGWFNGTNARAANVTLSESGQPFWMVFRDICTRANINLYEGGDQNDRAIQLMPGNYGGNGMLRAAVSIQGPFLSMLSNVERENTVNMSDPTKVVRTIHIQLQSYAEPKVTVSEASYRPTIDEAADDNGNAMKQDQQMGDQNLQESRGIGWYGSIDLPYPTTNPGTQITKLKGHTAAKIQLSSEPWEIADPVNAPETAKTIGGKSITFKSLKKEGDRYFLSLLFELNDQNRSDFYRMINHQQQFHLTDAQGNESESTFNGSTGDEKSMTVRYGFRPGFGVPAKLVMEIATAGKDISVPFELVNVPMP